MTDTTAPMLSRRRETTRQRLLDAAAEVFAEVGLDAASVEAVCDRAGFTRGAFYSNFDSKDELMLALVARVAEHKLEQVAERVQQLDDAGSLSPAQLVLRVLDVTIDERTGILLTSEIRTRAMRDPRLAEAYLAWQDGMVQRIAALIVDIGARHRLTPRLPPTEFARLFLQTWEDTSATAIMAGLDHAEMCVIVNERTAALAAALVDPA